MTIYLNHKKIQTTIFSGGECQVRLAQHIDQGPVSITANLFNANDIMELLLCIDALKRINPNVIVNLTIPYFPYARQDRVCHPGEALSAKVMADLINNLECQSVSIVDPHSDVTPALIKNCIVTKLADIVTNSSLKGIITKNKLQLVSPDAGAEKKVHAVYKKLLKDEIKVESFTATKIRNPESGEITDSQIYGDITGKNLIILDDICDGGRTFVELAKTLKKKGACDLYLYVTHGIFSKGLSELDQYFNKIYCYHLVGSKQPENKNKLTILKGENHAY